MKRRDFIKMGSFITVSVAALGVTACGSSDVTDTGDTDISSPNPSRPMPAAATGAGWKFPQSIASGDPKNDSIMLWTRVVPSTLTDIKDSSTSTAIKLQVTTADNSGSFGSNAALTGTLIADVTVPAYGDFDGTVRHKLTGLTAGTTYFYQFIAGDVRSNVGRFKTAPAAASTADVKFAFMSCQDWSANHWGAFSQIVADDGAGSTPSLDFIVHLGDYIYETSSDETGEALHAPLTLPSTGDYAANTADYRFLYKTFRSDPRLQRMHERFPMIAVWDDHEFSDDCWGDHETYSNANAEQKNRRRNANQAWFEYTPADIVYSETATSFQNIKIYRDLKFGETVHLVMTDERLYRADHMIPETTVNGGVELGRINSRYLAPETSYKALEGLKSPDGLGGLGDNMTQVTMLGATQRDWWKTTMADSTAKWKVWGNEVSLLRMGLNGNKALSQLIPLGIFGALTSSTASTGIAAIPKQVSDAVALQLATAPATPATTTIVVALTPQLIGGGMPAANAQALATSVAGAVGTSAAGGGDNTAKYTAAYTVLTGAGIPAATADALATAAVGVFNQALTVGNLVIVTAVTAAVGSGATQTIAGQGAYAITAKSASLTFPASPGDVPAYIGSLAPAGVAAGLNSTQAQAAAGAFYNAIAVGNITIASAVAGAATAGVNTSVAAKAAFAITATDAGYPNNAAALTAAAQALAADAVEAARAAAEAAALVDGLSAAAAAAAGTAAATFAQASYPLAAETAVAAYLAAKAVKPAGASSQILAAANQIAFVKAKDSIDPIINTNSATNKANSPFYRAATGKNATKVAAFFQKFLINADQWDGYSKERGQLMQFLLDEGVKDVVAITGDIHAFFAGEVYNNFPGQVTAATLTGAQISAVGEGTDTTDSTAAMVDLVTAGISSTSWFNYLKDAVDVLDKDNALIGKLVYVPVTIKKANELYPGSPEFKVFLNTLNYSMGKKVPMDTDAVIAASLAAELADQLKRMLSKAPFSVPEAGLATAVSNTIATIAASPDFAPAVGLCKTLAGAVSANPWLQYVETEAQGYAVVTASSSSLKCDFKKLNPLVGTAAPTTIVTSTKTATITAGITAVVMS